MPSITSQMVATPWEVIAAPAEQYRQEVELLGIDASGDRQRTDRAAQMPQDEYPQSFSSRPKRQNTVSGVLVRPASGLPMMDYLDVA
jgi:hypothetical protein